MEITWRIFDDSNDPITGGAASTELKIRRSSDGYMYDWNDSTFKNVGWGALATTLSEVDATNAAGLYNKTVTITTWNDGYYQLMTRYTGSPKRAGIVEIYIEGGKEMSDHLATYINSSVSAALSLVTTNLDMKVSDLPTASEAAAAVWIEPIRKLTSAYTDETPSRDMAATTPFTGVNAVGLSFVTSGLVGIADVHYTVLNSSGGVIGSAQADSNGVDTINLEDGTYYVLPYKAAVDFSGSTAIAVATGSTTFSMVGTPVTIAPPAAPNTCRVYLYAYDQDGTALSDIEYTVRIQTLPYTSGSGVYSKEITGVYNSSTGLLYFDIVYGATVQFIIPELGVNTYKTVPSTTTALLPSIT